jgi:tRNA A37 threonylcarbamoyladenosine dehydratase
MLHSFSRTELLLGKINMEKLYKSKIMVFGVGGVGSYTVEGLARSGIGSFILIDDDTVCRTNINRQIQANENSIGKPKVQMIKERILSINPKAKVETHQIFFMPDIKTDLFKEKVDYIIDAIDTVTAKIDIIIKAKEKNIPIISSMGTGNKISPTMLEITDIYKTSVCPLARVMRKELKKRNIDSLKVVYSKEKPLKPIVSDENSCDKNCFCTEDTNRKYTIKHQVPGSISFVPSVAGLIIAGEVVKDIISE